MKPENLLPICQSQLTLVLNFFPRVDSISSVLLAINTGIITSLWHLYKGAFPRLEGGEGSLIYFREIAKTTEANFVSEFARQDEPTYVNDLLGQVWRNSQILTEKFDHLKKAFWALGLAIVPWAIALLLNAANIAAKLSSIREDDYNTYITADVFNCLNDEGKYGGNPRRLMWEARNWAEGTKFSIGTVYRSNWWWPV
jgi:hypothetical protein